MVLLCSYNFAKLKFIIRRIDGSKYRTRVRTIPDFSVHGDGGGLVPRCCVGFGGGIKRTSSNDIRRGWPSRPRYGLCPRCRSGRRSPIGVAVDESGGNRQGGGISASIHITAY